VRFTTIVLSALFALVLAAARPETCLACSCVLPQPPLADLAAQNENLVVVVGRAAGSDGDRTLFGVESQYLGPELPAVIRVIRATVTYPDGTSYHNTCGLDLPTGVRMFIAMDIGEGGSLAPSVCLPHARADAPDGLAYIDEAEAAFGPARPPGAPATREPLATPATDLAIDPSVGTPLAMAAGFVLAAALTLVGGVALAARRRRRRRDPG
jgi:hypothetical protein